MTVTTALDLLFPPRCAACRALGPSDPFCPTCRSLLEPAAAIRLPGIRAAAVFAYGGPVADAILSLKYEGRDANGWRLGRLMRATARALGPCEVIVPVPLPPSRLLERGFNQSRELARGLDLPVLPRALARAEGRRQVGLSRAERLENLAGLVSPGPQPVRGRAVLLVDDVITTGATAEACRDALERAGARRIAFVALAAALRA